MKELFKVNEKYNSGVLEINQIMSKLLTLSKRFQLNYQEIRAVVCMGVQKIAPWKISRRSGSGFGLGISLELGLGGNFPPGQFS